MAHTRGPASRGPYNLLWNMGVEPEDEFSFLGGPGQVSGMPHQAVLRRQTVSFIACAAKTNREDVCSDAWPS